MGSGLVVAVFSIWAGCTGPSGATGGSGGAAGGASPAGGSSAGGSSTTNCVIDGICEYEMGETCDCADCVSTALCVPGLCTNTGTTVCDHVLDSCTCANCAEDWLCSDPTLANCTDGGACDPFVEGCHCPNCWAYPSCVASVAACSGGVPDGLCDLATEGCACVDCQGTPLCVPCPSNGSCMPEEACSCSDCAGTTLCNDPGRCVDGGACAIFEEGCVCDACKAFPECAQWLDGGVEGGDGAVEGGDGGP
jgi:hypothetical protein